MTSRSKLRTFLAVAETGSVRAAAEQLVVTESAVSAAVAALTREVGVQLIERQGRGLRVTQSGRTYAAYARAILDLEEEAVSAARGDRGPQHGKLRIVSVTTIGEHVLPPLLASFTDKYPDVRVTLDVGTTGQVWELFADRQADLAIAGTPPSGLRVRVHAMRDIAINVIGSPAVASKFDLSRTAWLVREAGSETRAKCESLLTTLKVSPPVIALGSNQAVIAGAITGLGVALVTRDSVTEPLGDGRLTEVAVPQTPMRGTWYAVTQGHFPATVQLFTSHLLTEETSEWWHP